MLIYLEDYWIFKKKKMLNIEIITCQPNLLKGPLNHSILKRAQEKNLVKGLEEK